MCVESASAELPMSARVAANLTGAGRRVKLWLLLAAALLAYACEAPPPPRSFVDFLDDSIARESVLLRCNQDRDTSANDPECVNARRAAAAIAARADEARRAELERESERKREAVRAAAAAEQQRQLEAARAAQAAQEAAYDAQWTAPASNATTDANTPTADEAAPAPGSVPAPEVAPAAPSSGSPASAAVPNPDATPESDNERLDAIAVPVVPPSLHEAPPPKAEIPRPFHEPDPETP